MAKKMFKAIKGKKAKEEQEQVTEWPKKYRVPGDDESKPKRKNWKQLRQEKEDAKAKQASKKDKYRKGKQAKDENDDSDFEVVPAQQHNGHADEAVESDSDDEDIFDALVPTSSASKEAVPARAPVTAKEEDEEEESTEDEKVIAEGVHAANRKKKKSGGFQSMGLSYPIFKAIMNKGFKVPTPIQRKSIPVIMDGKDVVGMARTGSGKTAAFIIPMLEKLKAHSAKVGARAIVFSPSRELAIQTQKVTKELAKQTDLRSCVLVGGDSLEDQFGMIASNPDILIATPGRLLHLVVEMSWDLRTVEYVVFDEADRLFEMGFATQLHELLSRLPTSRQTLLFSATLPKLLVEFAKAGLQDPVLIRLDADTKISRDLEMAFFSVKQNEKEAALLYVLRNVIDLPKLPPPSETYSNDTDKPRDKARSKRAIVSNTAKQTIVFVSTKHHVEYIAHLLTMAGWSPSYVYGSLDQTARNIQINNFRTGKTNLFIVTDVAARGIDIPVIENVVNYDFVDSSKVFVHRVGRTARAGKRGWAYSLVVQEELPYLMDLQLFLGRNLVIGGSSGQDLDYTSSIVLGTLPRDISEDDIEWVQTKTQDDVNLQGLQGVAVNGYKQYKRSRASASQESYQRAKEIQRLPAANEIHPLFTSQIKTIASQERENLVKAISSFRPNETIFEYKQSIRKASEASTVMRQRRQNMAKVIDKHKSQVQASSEIVLHKLNNGMGDVALSEADQSQLDSAFKSATANDRLKHSDTPRAKKAPETYKDPEFYMGYTQADANTEKGYAMNGTGSFMEQASTATLDLHGDERETMAQKQNQLRWDAKKKKFVRGTGIGADNKKLITTESGTKISASFKSGRFDEWAQKTRLDIPRAGEAEISSHRALAAVKRFKHNQVKEAKPLDPLAKDYEKKIRKRQAAEMEDGDHKAINGKKQRLSKDMPDKVKKLQANLGKRTVGTSVVKSELKSAATIRKERLENEKRRAKNARPSRGKGHKRR